MTPRAWLWLLLALVPATTYAETVYVVEQLVVTVSSSTEADAERVGQVKSGDKLELLERQGEEAHVKLANGTDGWIKSSYLSTEEPLTAKLTGRTAEVEKLKQDAQKLKEDVSHLQSQLAASRATASPPSQAAARSTAPPSTAPQPAVPPESAAAAEADATAPSTPIRDSVFLREPDRPGQTPWGLILGIAGAMLLVGFVLGWTTLDRRIRQKYGGLRIY
jgi:hypothetical protein